MADAVEEPMDPKEIVDILVPEYFAIRLRDYRPTTNRNKTGCFESSKERLGYSG